jgi:hypothetical protein
MINHAAIPRGSFWNQLLQDFAAIGYRPDTLPMPLIWNAPNTIAGALAETATADSPVDLGFAEILAFEQKSHGRVVVRVGGRDYFGVLQHDLFFAGPHIDTKGQLYYAENFCVLCPAGCTVGQAVEMMRQVPLSRDTLA